MFLFFCFFVVGEKRFQLREIHLWGVCWIGHLNVKVATWLSLFTLKVKINFFANLELSGLGIRLCKGHSLEWHENLQLYIFFFYSYLEQISSVRKLLSPSPRVRVLANLLSSRGRSITWGMFELNSWKTLKKRPNDKAKMS